MAAKNGAKPATCGDIIKTYDRLVKRIEINDNPYPNLTKYQFLLSLGIQAGTVVLFENEQAEIRKAIQYGLNENQIIKVKF